MAKTLWKANSAKLGLGLSGFLLAVRFAVGPTFAHRHGEPLLAQEHARTGS